MSIYPRINGHLFVCVCVCDKSYNLCRVKLLNSLRLFHVKGLRGIFTDGLDDVQNLLKTDSTIYLAEVIVVIKSNYRRYLHVYRMVLRVESVRDS